MKRKKIIAVLLSMALINIFVVFQVVAFEGYHFTCADGPEDGTWVCPCGHDRDCPDYALFYEGPDIIECDQKDTGTCNDRRENPTYTITIWCCPEQHMNCDVRR